MKNFNWDELKNEILKRTGYHFNIVFDKANLELRGRLIKIGGMK